jgi:amino-acid N-acetyltransferase
MPLPANCELGPADAADLGAIRWLVLSAWLDPTQLRWQQFMVVKHLGQVIACGQLRRYGPVQELGSLVVKSAWRNQGVGTALAQALILSADGPLYLECLGDDRASYYARLGFVTAQWGTMPKEMVRKFRFSAAISAILPISLHIMEYQPGYYSEKK